MVKTQYPTPPAEHPGPEKKTSSAEWCWPCPQPPSLDAVDDGEEFIATRPGNTMFQLNAAKKKRGWIAITPYHIMYTLPETNRSNGRKPLKLDRWKMVRFLLEFGLFSRGELVT